MRISLWVIVGIVILAVVATFVGFSGVKEYQRVTAIDREIATLNKEVARLERMNASLEDRITYFSSDDYKERVAKERLGRKRADEQVVALTYENGEIDKPTETNTAMKARDTTSSVREWIERLFGKHSSQ